MPLAALLWSVVTWLLREVILKFIIMGFVFLLVVELTPLVISALGSFINPTGLTSSFSSIPPGVWFFLDFFALDVGIPLLITAHVSRFVIRRIPFIG